MATSKGKAKPRRSPTAADRMQANGRSATWVEQVPNLAGLVEDLRDGPAFERWLARRLRQFWREHASSNARAALWEEERELRALAEHLSAACSYLPSSLPARAELAISAALQRRGIEDFGLRQRLNDDMTAITGRAGVLASAAAEAVKALKAAESKAGRKAQSVRDALIADVARKLMDHGLPAMRAYQRCIDVLAVRCAEVLKPAGLAFPHEVAALQRIVVGVK